MSCPAQHEGLVVSDVVVLINREQGGAARMASNGLALHSAFTLSFILQVCLCQLHATLRPGACGPSQHVLQHLGAGTAESMAAGQKNKAQQPEGNDARPGVASCLHVAWQSKRYTPCSCPPPACAHCIIISAPTGSEEVPGDGAGAPAARPGHARRGGRCGSVHSRQPDVHGRHCSARTNAGARLGSPAQEVHHMPLAAAEVPQRSGAWLCVTGRPAPAGAGLGSCEGWASGFLAMALAPAAATHGPMEQSQGWL